MGRGGQLRKMWQEIRSLRVRCGKPASRRHNEYEYVEAIKRRGGRGQQTAVQGHHPRDTGKKRHGTGGEQRSHQRQVQQHHHTAKVWHGALPSTTRGVKKGSAAGP